MRCFLCLIPFVLVSVAAGQQVDLLSDPKLENFTAYFSERNSLSTDKDEVYSVDENGVLRVSGEGFGYLRSNAEYENFHMVLEYKWGEHTWSRRVDRARDAGVFTHIHGEDGAFYGAFPSGVEVQLIEGGSGNLNVLGTKETEAYVSGAIEKIDEKNGKYQPVPAAVELRAKPKVTVYTNYRSDEWTDVKGYRGPGDVEEIFGEWNRLEIICEGKSITVKLNGRVVSAGELELVKGKVGVQSEWAEWFVRRWEIYELGDFNEEWESDDKTTNTGSGAELMPRSLPWSPEESLAALEVDGEFDIELVVAEPLVCDPVDVVWDDKGRMFVAEMRDYPLPAAHGPLLSRIRLLEDEDGDGKPDRATTWADNLDHVQGLLPMQGGILATTRTKILFFKDEDNDGFAEEPKVVFQSNEPSHSQLQVSSARWGRDNWIYLNNGLNGKEIYPGDDEDAKVTFSSRNIRVHPVTHEIQAVSGYGQFGATIDDWGRRFACTNRNPVIFANMPLAAVSRNPHAGLTKGHVDIAPFGGDSKVYPYELSHTTSNAHLGTHTAACGHGIYRGDLVPDLKGDIFVCEPPGQLVTRAKFVADGSSFKAERFRVGKQTEFLRSRDEWFRPVNIRTGPDGALYVCDMYRRFIDHARFFPDEFQQAHYMRAGFDQGRIYRIVPKGGAAKAPQLPESQEDWIAALGHSNGWMRETAQRLLVEAGDKDVAARLIDILEDEVNPLAKLHIIQTLNGLGGLPPQMLRALMNVDEDPGLLENVIEIVEPLMVEDNSWIEPLTVLTEHKSARVRYRAAIAIGGVETGEVTRALATLAVRDSGDEWIGNAILAGSKNRGGEIFEVVAGGSEVSPDFLTRLAAAIAARGDLDEMKTVMDRIGDLGSRIDIAIIDGLAQGLRRHKGELKLTSLAQFLSRPPERLADNAKKIQLFVDEAAIAVYDARLDVETRLYVFPMLNHLSRDEKMKHFTALIDSKEPPEIRAAAWKLAAGLDRNKLADLLFEQWPKLDPSSRGEAIKLLVGGGTAIRLMKEMKAGNIDPGLVDPMSRWVWLRSKNEEMKTLAEELFTQPSADRAGVLNDYRAALELEGDVEHGREIFTVNCAICHRVDGAGADIGPDITDVRNKPIEGLLSDILDPNRASEARWTGYAIELTDGRRLLGLIAAETADAITFKGLGVDETVPRDQVKSMTEVGQSLMPVGLEGAIDKQGMADLLEFLRKR